MKLKSTKFCLVDFFFGILKKFGETTECINFVFFFGELFLDHQFVSIIASFI